MTDAISAELEKNFVDALNLLKEAADQLRTEEKKYLAKIQPLPLTADFRFHAINSSNKDAKVNAQGCEALAAKIEAFIDPKYSDVPTETTKTKQFDGDHLVWRKVPNGSLRHVSAGNPRFRHPDFDSAVTEAKRLCDKFPESLFVILREVACVKATQPVVQNDELIAEPAE